MNQTSSSQPEVIQRIAHLAGLLSEISSRLSGLKFSADRIKIETEASKPYPSLTGETSSGTMTESVLDRLDRLIADARLISTTAEELDCRFNKLV